MTGTVTNVTDFGLFLELEEGIEGLVHVSEIASDKKGNPLSRFQIDDVIQAKVINVSREEKKIGLSIRKLDETSEKDILRGYLNSNQEATSNLGELLREEMMNFEGQSQAKKAPDSGEKVQLQEEEISEPASVSEIEDSDSPLEKQPSDETSE